jgi:hypothetical protein
MPLFQIGVTFFEYATWIYSDMSAVLLKQYPKIRQNEYTDLLNSVLSINVNRILQKLLMKDPWAGDEIFSQIM